MVTYAWLPRHCLVTTLLLKVCHVDVVPHAPSVSKLSSKLGKRILYRMFESSKPSKGLDGRYRYVYVTWCYFDSTYYFGKHVTDRLGDGYIGSGALLKRKIEKYGKEAFARTMLHFAEDDTSLRSMEQWFLDRNVGQPGCMNLSHHSAGSTRRCVKRPDLLGNDRGRRYWTGRKRTESDKRAKSVSAKERIASGVNHASVHFLTCPHCSVTTNVGNARRWHFDKCKNHG